MEFLLQQLTENIRIPQQNTLAAETILVQNPGVKRWLQLQISQRHGIAANLNFPLPTRFIWFVYQTLFEDVADLSIYEPGVLRWIVFQQFSEANSATEFTDIQRYLQDDPSAIKRYQLAQRVATLFDSYLVYRPQLIQKWQSNNMAESNDERWQAQLWRDIFRQINKPHRAQLMQNLKKHLQQSSPDLTGLPERLHIFGISAIAPAYLDILNQLARHMPVHLYVFNPCQHYWGDIADKKTALKRADTTQANSQSAESLLASLGQQGQEFIDLLYELDNPPHEVDDFQPSQSPTLLAQLQNDLLDLKAFDPAQAKPAFDDDSIQLHNCYSPVRELQVLHDNLLDMFEQDADLKPHDVVVMCPDINPLAPYIHAIFGQQPSARQLPYNLSDQNSLATSPLIQFLLESLRINSARLSSNQLLGWLEIPALQRKFGFENGQLDIIRHWVAENGILWGLNKSHRQNLGFGDDDLNSWQFGIDRLLAAYCLGADADMLADVVPSDFVLSSEELKLLGQLQKLLDQLDHWARLITDPCTLAQWQQRFNQFIEQNFALDESDEMDLKILRSETESWRQQADLAQFDQLLKHQLIHTLLQDALVQFSNQHQYLSGGITICNLIPMRNIPFKVVCLLGMGDAQFPRKMSMLSFDLLQRHPQKGDRSRREDDRYLFLQSLLCARQKLYISYVGHSQKDNSERQLSVVVSELIEYIDANYQTQNLLTEHPLQAFSQRCFDRGSYADLWYAATVPQNSKSQRQTFNQPLEKTPAVDDIRLNDLMRFFANPAKYFLQNRLNMRLSPYDDILPDQEQFELGGLEQYKLRQTILDARLQQKTFEPASILRTGSLPAAQLGQLQLSQQQQLVESIIDGLNQRFDRLKPQTFVIDYRAGDIQISGQVSSQLSGDLLQVRIGDMHGNKLLAFWIQHLLLSASQQIGQSYLAQVDKKTGQINLLSFDLVAQPQAQEILALLIALFQQGQQSALAFYPDAALLFCQQSIGKQADWAHAKSHVEAKWHNGFLPMFEAQDEYLQKLIGQTDPFTTEFMQLAESIFKPVYDHLSEGSI